MRLQSFAQTEPHGDPLVCTKGSCGGPRPISEKSAYVKRFLRNRLLVQLSSERIGGAMISTLDMMINRNQPHGKRPVCTTGLSGGPRPISEKSAYVERFLRNRLLVQLSSERIGGAMINTLDTMISRDQPHGVRPVCTKG